MVDSMIRRAMGGKPKKPRQFLPTPTGSPAMLSPTSSLSGKTSPQLPPRAPSPSGSYLAPPPYSGRPASPSYTDDKPPLPPRRSPSPSYMDDKPSLPPRRSPSPVPPPMPPRTASGAPESVVMMPQPQPAQRLSTKDRVLLSADLILSTLDHETRRLLDTGTETIGAVVGHRYGPDAAQNSLLLAGTARNVGLVYIDMSGIGRRALLKRAGKQFIKARVSSNKGQ